MDNVLDIEKIDADIETAMNLLYPLADKYKPEQWAHYVVRGEYEEEVEGGNYCESCIDEAIEKVELRYRKERGKKHLIIRDLERFGYVIRERYNLEYGCMALSISYGDKKMIKRLKKELKEKYPPTTFGYRYYSMDGGYNSHQHCDECGIIIRSCVTADEQEIEHWEGLDGNYFVISEMNEYIAYEIYGILEFIHQAKEEIHLRGHAIALKIIQINS